MDDKLDRALDADRQGFCLFFFLIFFFLAALGLRCSKRGLLFVAVHGLLIGVASFVVEHRL